MTCNGKFRYDLYIFDVDGTVLDTSEGILTAIKGTVEKFGFAMPDGQTLRTFIGPPIQDSFASVFNLDRARADECAACFREIYKNKTLLQARLYDGIVPLFARLRQCGRKVAVATYKREDYALTLLKHFGVDGMADSIHGADIQGKLKKSDLISLCMRECGVSDVSKTIMIGDTMHDYVAAKQCGTDFLAVTYGFGFRRGDERLPGVRYADSAQEIFDMAEQRE